MFTLPIAAIIFSAHSKNSCLCCTDQLPGAVLPATLPGVTFSPSSSTNYSAPKFTLNYKPEKDFLLYGSVSKGVKPAGFLNVGVVLDVNGGLHIH